MVAADQGDNFLEPPDPGGIAGHYLNLPPLLLGVSAVHPEQVTDKQGGLIPAGASPDLKKGILIIVGVLGEQGNPQVLDQLLLTDFKLGKVSPDKVLEFAVLFILKQKTIVGDFPVDLLVVVVQLIKLCQVGMFLGHPAKFGLIICQLRL